MMTTTTTKNNNNDDNNNDDDDNNNNNTLDLTFILLFFSNIMLCMIEVASGLVGFSMVESLSMGYSPFSSLINMALGIMLTPGMCSFIHSIAEPLNGPP